MTAGKGANAASRRGTHKAISLKRSKENKPSRAGIRDLADAVGLSISTVSRALNGYSDVNPKTQLRIEEAAREIGYSANYAAAVLRSQRTRTVTFIAPRPWTKFVDPFHLGLLDGLEMALQAENYDLHVVMARDMDSELKILKRVVEQGRCDGILFGRTMPRDERVDYLLERAFPLVALGRTERDDHDWVDRDHFQIGKQATQRLIERGHTCIAVLSTQFRFTYSNAAVQGYRAALAEAGLPHDPSLEADCSPLKTGDKVFRDMLASGTRPTAIFCGNDMIAISVMDGMRRSDLRPGQDIALIGCDDIPISAYLTPALTTFTQDLDQIGTTMGKMMLSRLQGRSEYQRVVIESELIERATDCARKN